MSVYLPSEEHPDEITLETYWTPGNGRWYLRKSLGTNHPENMWNWFKRTHPNLNPELYGIKDPIVEDLIREIISLRKTKSLHS